MTSPKKEFNQQIYLNKIAGKEYDLQKQNKDKNSTNKKIRMTLESCLKNIIKNYNACVDNNKLNLNLLVIN
jgi:hypothetical protein